MTSRSAHPTLHRKARRDLVRLGLQGVTVAILIGCGVGLLVSSWSSYESLRRAKESFYHQSRFADCFADLKRAPRYLTERIRRWPGVVEVDDRVVLFGRIHRGTDVAMARLVSLPALNAASLNQVRVLRGKIPSSFGDQSELLEVLVHVAYAEAHSLELGDRLRVVVEGVERKLKVVGFGLSPDTVYALSGRSPFPDDRRFGVFWIARSVLEQWGTMKDSFNHLSLKLEPLYTRATQSKLEQLLSPYGGRSVTPASRQISNLIIEDEIRQQRVSAFLYPLIFLLVAAFLIHVATSRWVELQRAQIATLKSLGYSHLDLLAHLFEVTFWILLGGTGFGLILGAGLGKVLSLSYQHFFKFPSFDYRVTPQAISLGLMAGILPGLMGSLASLRRIFMLEPAEAMRPPAPPDFRQNWIASGASIPLRMVLRNLFLRRMRLGFAIFGVALGVSIVVLSSAWRDVVSFMIRAQFFDSEREDISAFLYDAKPVSILDQMRNIPGVLAVEGYRLAPARIRYRQSDRDVAILGWRGAPRHRGFGGKWLGDGVLIPSALARLWSMKEGDSIRIEFQTGAAPVRVERVAGFTESRMGHWIFMPLSKLAKILDETPSVSLVTIQGVKDRWDSIQRSLEEIPGVAGAAIKSWRLQGFNRTVGKIIRISTWVLGTFAFLIASGVVFNLVRVSFSERSWEMASLRVFGFSEIQVFLVLAREMFFQVIASLPPGSALGYGWLWLSRFWIHTEAFTFPAVIEPKSYGFAALVAGLALILGLTSCWWRTRKLSPIAALQAPE